MFKNRLNIIYKTGLSFRYTIRGSAVSILFMIAEQICDTHLTLVRIQPRLLAHSH